MPTKPKTPKEVRAHKHRDKRLNIPTAEVEPVMCDEDKAPKPVRYKRNTDLDPQLVWRGKDEQDSSDLVAWAPPLYIQEKVQSKALIDNLMAQTAERREVKAPDAPDLFADFNGLPDPEARAEFYAHQQNWTNRMIAGDSLSVMASLAEREGLRGKVQCIYFDPPYGIKFNSNFQWSTTSLDVRDGKADHVTREPEMVKAFRDTWRDGIHSYLSYLRDRLTVARDLLHESGSIFVQIGDENVHRVRSVMDETFGEDNFICAISAQKTGSQSGNFLQSTSDDLLWYAKQKSEAKHKFRSLFLERAGACSNLSTIERNDYSANPLTSEGISSTSTCNFKFEGRNFHPGKLSHWKVPPEDLRRVGRAGRIVAQRAQIRMKYFFDDYPVIRLGDYWNDIGGATNKVYVVQTSPKLIQRCIMMTTDPGDLVLDPTCGSGTTAYVAEQWGRRWITIDTSRVAIALARSRLMGALYPWYFLADSPEGQMKEAAITRLAPKTTPTRGSVRQGFVYERVPHITLKSIANNAEIDVIWEKFQEQLEPLRKRLNTVLNKTWEEWEIPREAGKDWPKKATKAHSDWWQARIARQKGIDASIAAKAEFEYLYDKPYTDSSKIRVAGPFTVESLSPHRTLAVDWDDELIDGRGLAEAGDDFGQMILENLKTAGVQQAHREDRITFTSLTGWPGNFICAEGVFMEGKKQKRAGIFIGPEFGTVSRPDLMAAAREAGAAKFDLLISCAFNYDAHSAEFKKLGRVPVLKARMNPDLHMGGDLKSTGAGNLFVIFGEPDIKVEDADDGMIRVRVRGVDVFKPQTGKVESEGTDGIAMWMLDTDYNEESFFVRHAYFLGANDPYKALKRTLKAEIDQEAWESLHSDTSCPFPKPDSGRIAVKVINHLGDEVMKVFRV